MNLTTLTSLKAEMSLPVLRDLAPLQDGDEETGEYAEAGVSNTILEAVNEQVCSEVYGYTRGKYAEPFVDPVDPLITLTVNELMTYRLWSRRDAANLPEGIQKKYQLAVARLKSIQKMEITLTATPVSAETGQGASYVYKSPPAMFPAGFTRSRGPFRLL